MVQQQMPLILDIQTDEWWQLVTVPTLDRARKQLRLLIKLIDKQGRKPIYTDFEDQIGAETGFSLLRLRGAGQLRTFSDESAPVSQGALRSHRDS